MNTGFTDYLADAVLDYFFGGGVPATLYFGLSTTTPAADGTGITEPSTGSYARVAKTNNPTNFPAAAAHIKSNGTAITFPTATADLSAGANMTHFFIADDPAAGNILCAGPLSSPQPILDTQTFAIGLGELVLRLIPTP